jgi:hypothetical protein
MFRRTWIRAFCRTAVPLKKQKMVERLVDRILAAKQRDPAADTSEWEREVDQLVYSLYGLTSDEITLIENSAQR